MVFRQKIIILAVFFSFFYLFVCQIQAIWPFTIDDMYISLRYAKNWADGLGLLWNAGEAPVEGYSNFSFVLLGRIALNLGLNPVLLLKSLGVVGLFFSCIAIYNLSRFWFLAHIAIIPCVWLLAYKGQILWSVSGLETTCYQALVAMSVVFIFKGLGYNVYPQPRTSYNYKFFIASGLMQAIAAFTRPEAPAIAALFACLLLFHFLNTGSRKTRKGFILFVMVFIACYAPYFLWRMSYYGRFFPNPVYCKGLIAGSESIDFVLDKQYLKLVWPFALLALPAIWKAHDLRHYFLWLPSVLYGFLLLGASPIVAFDNRLFLPAFILMLPLALQGLRIVWALILKRKDDVLDFASYVVAFIMIILAIPFMTLSEFRHFTINPMAGEGLRMNVVDWLEKNTTATSRVVLADSGMIPYKSGLKFTDSYCLNNIEMTQPAVPEMYEVFCKNVLKSQPDVIILTSLIKNKYVEYTPADQCMAPILSASHAYQLQASLSTGNKSTFYRYEIYQIKPHL